MNETYSKSTAYTSAEDHVDVAGQKACFYSNSEISHAPDSSSSNHINSEHGAKIQSASVVDGNSLDFHNEEISLHLSDSSFENSLEINISNSETISDTGNVDIKEPTNDDHDIKTTSSIRDSHYGIQPCFISLERLSLNKIPQLSKSSTCPDKQDIFERGKICQENKESLKVYCKLQEVKRKWKISSSSSGEENYSNVINVQNIVNNSDSESDVPLSLLASRKYDENCTRNEFHDKIIKAKENRNKKLTTDHKKLDHMKKICRVAGIPVFYPRTFKDCKTDEDKIVALKMLLNNAGLKGELSIKTAKWFRLQKEAAELDTKNVIAASGRTRSSTKESPAPLSPKGKTQFRRITYASIQDIVDSEGSDSD